MNRMDAPAVKAASETGVRIETRAVVAVGVAPPAADGSGGAAAVGSMVSAVTQPVTVTLHSRSSDVAAGGVAAGSVIAPDTATPAADATPDRLGCVDAVADTGLEAVERAVCPFGDGCLLEGGAPLETATAPVGMALAVDLCKVCSARAKVSHKNDCVVARTPSLTVIVTDEVPTVVGTPEMSPVFALSASPAGRPDAA